MKEFSFFTLLAVLLIGCEADALTDVYQITVTFTNRQNVVTTRVFSSDTSQLIQPFTDDFTIEPRSAAEMHALAVKLNELGFAAWEDRDMPWQNFPQTLRIEVFQQDGRVLKELNDYNTVRFEELLKILH